MRVIRGKERQSRPGLALAGSRVVDSPLVWLAGLLEADHLGGVMLRRVPDRLRARFLPNQLGPEYNLHVLQAFAEHVAPALGWKPNTEGPVQGYAI